MRIKNSLKNFSSGILINITTSLLTFISRSIFIHVLGTLYLGVNGLLANVLAMLSLAELGIGTAINFSLYKPIAEKDDKKISILMNFYKIAYRYIGVLVFVIGLVIMLFLDVIIKDSGEVQNLRLIFFIYLINIVLSYFMTYKVTLLNAYQKAYTITKINLVFTIVNAVVQILVLIISKNYIIYLLSNMLVLFIQRIFVNRQITNMYPVLSKKVSGKLPKEELAMITKNVKAMIFHKIGDYCINGTDNIIISAFINIKTVGIYSNYNMIITMINNFILMFFNSITASMGNLIATESDEKKNEIFNVVNLIGFWFFGFASICLYNLLNPFIEIWIGRDFLISQDILIIVILNYYLTGMRVPVATVKSAAGIYNEDKYTPIIQSVVNLVISISLVKSWGLAGVFMGTLVSSLILPCWQRPYIVYKYVFKSSPKEYFIKYIKYLLVIVLTAIGIQALIDKLFSLVTVYNFIIRIVICVVVPNILFILIFRRSNEFIILMKKIESITGEYYKWISWLV